MQLEGFQKQIMLLEAGAEADRLQKGTELLDSEKMVVRIAGVAILRSIAVNPNHNFKSEAFRVLNAFALHASTQEEALSESDDNFNSSEDLQEAFRALLASHQNTNQRINSLQLFGVSLKDIVLSPEMAQILQFRNCTLTDCRLKFDTFFVFKNVRFQDCIIDTGPLDFTTFEECRFVRCRFTGKAPDGLEENNKFIGGDLSSLGFKKIAK